MDAGGNQLGVLLVTGSLKILCLMMLNLFRFSVLSHAAGHGWSVCKLASGVSFVRSKTWLAQRC